MHRIIANMQFANVQNVLLLLLLFTLLLQNK